MLSFNIFELLHKLFDLLFIPLEWIRLTLAKGDKGWWVSNIASFFFVGVLLVILSWWISQALKFKREGTEDHA